MTELSSKSAEIPAKVKWDYNSDEDAAAPSKPETAACDVASRYDDMKPLPRRSEFGMDNRSDDMRPLPRRNEFNNRRGGGDNFRGSGNFSRNRAWEPRGGRGGSNYPPRFNRNDDGRSWHDDDKKEFEHGDEPPRKSSWNEGKIDAAAADNNDDDDGEQSSSWGKPAAVTTANMDSPTNEPMIDVVVDKQGFAEDSDEEWGKPDADKAASNAAATKSSISEMLTLANLESSQGVAKAPVAEQRVEPVAAGDSDDEFGAWGAEQKTATKAPSNEAPPQAAATNWNAGRPQHAPPPQRPMEANSNGSPDDDEEYGQWGKKPAMAANHDSMQPLQPQQPFYSQQNQRPSYSNNNSNRGNDGNFGRNRAWESRGGRGGSLQWMNVVPPQQQDRFGGICGNSNSGNSYGNNGGSGGGSYGNNGGSGSSGSYGNSNHQQQQQHMQGDSMMTQLGMAMPPYSFNPTQRPPQWPPMGGMSSMGGMGAMSGMGGIGGLGFQTMCNGGQMPFGAMPLLPAQMPFSPMASQQGQGIQGQGQGQGQIQGQGQGIQGQGHLQQQQAPSQAHLQQQQPSQAINSLMHSMTYIPPPPPSTQPPLVNHSSSSSGHSNSYPNNGSGPPSQKQLGASDNLLETIMTNVGLSSKSIRLQPDAFKPHQSQQQQQNLHQQHNKNSVSDSLSSIIKSAASTVLSRLVENSQKPIAMGNVSDSMSMSPPSPASSPPPRHHHQQHQQQQFLLHHHHQGIPSGDSAEFVLPPLPNYADVLKPSAAAIVSCSGIGGGGSGAGGLLFHSSNASSSLLLPMATGDISEEKRNRSDFESKGDWQERIALEVKNFLRPAYMSKKINKSDYKEIMKRCVTKVRCYRVRC